MCSNNPNRNSDNIDTLWSHITPNLLKIWINDNNTNLLIIDSRNSNEYNQSHIKNSINIPHSRFLKRNLIEDKTLITELLIKNSNINQYYNDFKIVVYDKNSEHTNQLEYDSFIIILLKKLAQKFKSVSFLIGGFINFKLNYSYFCESFNNLNKNKNSDICENENLNEKNSKKLTMPSSTTTNNIYHHTITVPSTLCLRSTVPIISTRQTAAAAFNNEIIASNSNPYNHEITQILPFLYLGSQNDALCKEKMNNLNITCIINVSIHSPKPDFIDDKKFLRIPIDDSHCAKLLPFFENAFKFIEDCRKSNSNILIHCLAGISRSPTLAIAYIMKYMSKSFDDAYDFIKKKRPTISPNFNFLGQLLEYEKQIKTMIVTNNNSSSILNIANPLIKTINTTCQTFFTISKAVTTTTKTTCSTILNQIEEKPKKELNKLKLNLNTNILHKSRKPFTFNTLKDVEYSKDLDCVKILVNPLYSRTSSFSHQQHQQQQPSVLLSPCQALEKFNFNSPSIEKPMHELFSDFEKTSTTKTIITNSLSNLEDLNSNENSNPMYPSVKFRHLNKINEHQVNNNEQNQIKFMPKSCTMNTLSDYDNKTASNSFKLCLTRKITTNYKRSAPEKLDIIDIEQENSNIDNDDQSSSSSSSSNDSTINNNDDKKIKQKSLPRPSSINLIHQHLVPTTGIAASSISSTCSSLSMTSTSPYYTPTSTSSTSSTELQIDLNSKKMKLSPISDINPILSMNIINSQLFQQQINKSKSSENLIKTVNSENSSKFNSFLLNKSTNSSLSSDSKSFETIKSLFDDNNINNNNNNNNNLKNQSNSTKNSKNSLHGSIEKMIEVL